MSTANLSRQRRFWSQRAASWDHHAAHNPGLARVVDKVLEEANPQPNFTAVDLGCGSGQLTLRLASMVASVRAVDISASMIELLMKNAKASGISNIEGQALPIEHVAIEDGTVDLIVSNYALHHLRDRDKAAAIAKAAAWLKPGGRIVIGDMMFGRGGDQRDREIISSKLALMVRRGPAGWWRIAKNSVRYLARVQERPVSMSTWVKYFNDAGLVAVEAIPVVSEAAVVRGERQAST